MMWRNRHWPSHRPQGRARYGARPRQSRSNRRSSRGGTLKGWEDVKVGAEKSGRVVKVLHDVGDRVKPGEPLVELEAINADLAVRQAEQRLISELAKLGTARIAQGDISTFRSFRPCEQAQVAVDRAEQKFAREQRLAEKKVNTSRIVSGRRIRIARQESGAG